MVEPAFHRLRTGFRHGFPAFVLPGVLRRLQKRQGPHHIGLRERERILYAPVHMAFRRKVDDTVYIVPCKYPAYGIEIADVRLYESVIGSVFDILEIGKIAGVCQSVQIDDMVVRIPVHEKAYDMAPYEARSAGYQYVSLCHVYQLLNIFLQSCENHCRFIRHTGLPHSRTGNRCP